MATKLLIEKLKSSFTLKKKLNKKKILKHKFVFFCFFLRIVFAEKSIYFYFLSVLFGEK